MQKKKNNNKKMAFLELHKISKSYSAHRVLRKVSVQLDAGVVALLGPNGAGKSTLLNILSTQQQASSGHYSLHEKSSQKELSDIRAQIGMVGHRSFLYADLSLEENLHLYGNLYNIPDKSQRIIELAEQFELTKRLPHHVGQFSRGLLQRASLIRALLPNPSLLLLDEPFTGLDWPSTQMLLQLIQDWRSPDRLLILTTHDLARAATSADRLLILNRGRVAADITGPLEPQELQQQYTEATQRP